MEKLETNSPEDIQRQQADLQAKILSLLGSNAVVPSHSSAPAASPGTKPAPGGSYESNPGRSGAASYHSSPRPTPPPVEGLGVGLAAANLMAMVVAEVEVTGPTAGISRA